MTEKSEEEGDALMGVQGDGDTKGAKVLGGSSTSALLP